MPGVGGRSFPYNAAGQRQAKKYARRTGHPMSNTGGYGQGMDRRGGARTGLLGRTSRPFGMRGQSSPFRNLSRQRPGGGTMPNTIGGGRGRRGTLQTPRANRMGRFSGGLGRLGGRNRRGY